MHGCQWNNGPCSEMPFTSYEENKTEYPHNQNPTSGKTSLCILQRVLHFFCILVTTVQKVKIYFTAMCYNFVMARFLDRIAYAIEIEKKQE
ncbi:hypothetical protein ACNF40_05025 [Cuniculiplasma sp. SKW4]|uniref:hypothetical protein n=1 Tax=Cuniculiplasma sp. SKW4 TaxID=3400171 RepID=UPI003FD26DA5